MNSPSIDQSRAPKDSDLNCTVPLRSSSRAMARPDLGCQHLAIVLDSSPLTTHDRGAPGALKSLPATAGSFWSALDDTIVCCLEHNVPCLSLILPHVDTTQCDVAGCIKPPNCLFDFIRSEGRGLEQQGVKIRIIGDDNPEIHEFLREINNAEQPCGKKLLQLNLAINYDGRREVILALQHLADEIIRRDVELSAIEASQLEQHLLTRDLPAVDLLLRTGGQTRLSQLPVWKSPYAELLFLEIPWSLFRRQHLKLALSDYASRHRTFGGLVK